MAVDLDGVSRALATQIRGYFVAGGGRDTNVYPYPHSAPEFPSITVYPPAGLYDYWQSFGPNSDAIALRLKLEVAANDHESLGIKIYAYLGVGAGSKSSIHDAVLSDPTLGGTVIDAAVTTAQIGDPDTNPGEAWLNVEIILKNAG